MERLEARLEEIAQMLGKSPPSNFQTTGTGSMPNAVPTPGPTVQTSTSVKAPATTSSVAVNNTGTTDKPSFLFKVLKYGAIAAAVVVAFLILRSLKSRMMPKNIDHQPDAREPEPVNDLPRPTPSVDAQQMNSVSSLRELRELKEKKNAVSLQTSDSKDEDSESESDDLPDLVEDTPDTKIE